MNTFDKTESRKPTGTTRLFCTTLLVTAIIGGACSKEDESVPESAPETSGFVLTSPEIGADSLMPAEFTCDGASASLPLAWSGSPSGTKCFALIMHHEASPTDIHWYWVLYNIPVTVKSLEKNATGTGTAGNNSVNGKTEYTPPCSKGPGLKKYTLTLYALSATVSPAVPDSLVSREVLLEAIKNITLSSASLTVLYSRDI